MDLDSGKLISSLSGYPHRLQTDQISKISAGRGSCLPTQTEYDSNILKLTLTVFEELEHVYTIP